MIARRAVAEFTGTAFLLTAVVGSGIMGEQLASGSVGLALLANAIATGAALYALIQTFGPISGAHFNPLVSLAAALDRRLDWPDLATYVTAQTTGAVVGVCMAHAMFSLPMVQTSLHERSGSGQWLGEFIATLGLLTVIEHGGRHAPATVPAAVALYILAAYWFTSSTSFANPAVTLARAFTDTFAGIAPASVLAFIAAQAAGAAAAWALAAFLARR